MDRLTLPASTAAESFEPLASAVAPDYYPWFDWLRITLACVVMLGHDGLIPVWDKAGNFAVQIFFALSGWLIGALLLQQSRATLPRFYFNRAIRIWVPYYIALALLLAASLLRDPVTAKWLEFIGYKLSFVYNLFGPPQLAEYRQAMPLAGTGNHFWSVNAEEQFYLIAPLLLVLIPSRWGRSIPLWTGIALLAWLSGVFASIGFGVLAAVLASRHQEFQRRSGIRLGLLATAALSAMGLAAGLDYDLLAPFCAISIVLLLAVRGRQHPWGKLAGGISYPLYLNHWIGVFVGNALLTPFGLRESPVRHLLSLVLNLALAAALYWWIDRPLLATRNGLYSPAWGQRAILTAYGLVIAGTATGLVLLRLHIAA